ncbi:hypothetical protein [Pedobacter sandarakinus]|uniref:hypothetical protein n=1 Tax=Pedobacter sandarakinus TaxID=353156 RepID=UPI0022467D0F|nr:hypothetical protein [Pedobacter sandarakinus]MCX2575371.1 hypothetical protein [Pedobacter sandarakinus]
MKNEEIKAMITLAPMLINFLLLFNRKKAWVKNKYKWIILLALSLIGIFLFNGSTISENKTDQKLIQWAFITPLAFSVIDYALLKASYLLHNRDLYLWLRGSSEIDDNKLSGGNHVRVSDRLFSFLLLVTIMILPFFILFFSENDK